MTNGYGWAEANQRDLARALDQVRLVLARHVDPQVGGDSPLDDDSPAAQAAAPNDELAVSALERRFGLSAFERDILLLCAGAEMDAEFASLIAACHGDLTRRMPTFGLALAALPDAHWSAITPAGPLRAWRLVELAGPGVTSAPLRIEERVLSFLAGIDHTDERLQGLVEVVTLSSSDAGRPASYDAIATGIAENLRADAAGRVVQVVGGLGDARLTIATAACAAVGARMVRLRASAIHAGAAESFALARLVGREAVLHQAIVVVDASASVDDARLAAFVDAVRAPVIVCGAESRALLAERGPTFDVPAVGYVDWSRPRAAARAQMNGLAQRIQALPAWDELVLPESQLAVLRGIAAHVRHRHRVYDEWGFAEKSTRGLGITALFAGPSGTGKTMAAEVLARELDLDLYRIDLASVVSKYIGETEKNLQQLFDAAEGSGAILFFDEADALFGKRSEVKDSHDRYANIEVSYLLQRMESYTGLAILTTNMKSALDPAFLRRIRFLVHFAFPDTAQRAAIWRGIFPTRTPTAPLEWSRLAQLNVAGGNIRNIALGAAVLAADREQVVSMQHVAEAARAEYGKLERLPSDVEMRGWGQADAR